MANRAYRWIWRLSLRARLTLLATAVLAIGLGAGGTLLVGTVTTALFSNAETGLRQTTDNIAALVKADQLPDVLPAAPSQLVQVVNGRGQVVAHSTTADAFLSIVSASRLASAASGGSRLSMEEHEPGRDGPLWVQVTAVGAGDDLRYVIVATSIKDAIDGGKVVRNSVGIGFPILLLVLAGLSWMVVGATLRPVESLRRGAAEITGSGGARRLPVPDAQDEVQRLAVTLNDMLSRLEAARDRQRAFVADAAHELRSPLASLRTQLEIAARRSPELSTEDLLAEIDRLSRLVDDLLLLARMDAGMVAPPRSEEVDMAEVARGMAKRYDGVEVVAPDEVPLVTGDRDQLSRVVANLLDNAVRHARTSVRVAVSSSDGEVVVRVSDDGPGIPAGDRTCVFERFTRLDDARARDDGGVGLGLAIVADLVRAHGGVVVLDDASPGLVATVRLPALS